MAGALTRFFTGATPPMPPANYVTLFVDSADDNLKQIDSAGVVTDLTATVGGIQSFIDFNSGIANAGYLEARVFYDMEKKALSYYNDESDTTINIGQEIVIRVRNDSGVTIMNGQAVRVIGSTGGLPTIQLALADTVDNATSAGVATHDIPNNDTGYITAFGSIGGLNTDSFSEGDVLFLSQTTPGGLVNIEQQILSPMAIVLTSDLTDGTIFVRPRGVINITAITQVTKDTDPVTQLVTTTPSPLASYANTSLPGINVTTTFTAQGGHFEAKFDPASIGAAGFYEISFSVGGSYSSNAQDVIFELYINGSASGLTVILPFDGLANGSTASTSFTVITPVVITDTDTLEIYVYNTGGSDTLTFDTSVFNVKRIGNA